jgi:hypothetical protein
MQCFKQEGEKLAIILNAAQSTHYAARSSSLRCIVENAYRYQLPCKLFCLPGVAGVGFKHKPAQLNNHTIFPRKRIFPSEKRGTDEKED